MSRDFRSEAEQEARQSEAYRQWVGLRVSEIHRRISASDVLDRYGVKLRYGGGKAEQISCPFHGKDNRPSTRYYPAHDGKNDSVWCFVCQKPWDAIRLFQKFEQLEGPFTRVLTLMERSFGLQTPEMPQEAMRLEDDTPLGAELEQLFGICERRLVGAKQRFTMEGYLKVGSVIDRLHFQVLQGKQTRDVATQTLRKVLDKIGEKERANDVR